MGAQGAQAEGVVAFGQPHAVGVVQQRAMIEPWRGQAERPVDEQLAKRALDEVGAAHDLGDGHFGVVHGAGELVARHVVFAPHEEVAKIAAGYGALFAKTTVGESKYLAIRHAEPPVDGNLVTQWRQRGVERRTEFFRVNRLVFRIGTLVRRADSLEHVAPRARAGKDQPGGVQRLQGGAIVCPPAALVVGRMRPAGVRPRRGPPARQSRASAGPRASWPRNPAGSVPRRGLRCAARARRRRPGRARRRPRRCAHGRGAGARWAKVRGVRGRRGAAFLCVRITGRW